MSDKIEALSDGSLEKVAGGQFGETEHTFKVTDQNFGSFVNSALHVVLFGVEWSSTCETASDIIETLAAKHNRIRVGIFEVSNSNYLRHRYNIKNLPTTIRFRGGTEVQRVEGTNGIIRLF